MCGYLLSTRDIESTFYDWNYITLQKLISRVNREFPRNKYLYGHNGSWKRYCTAVCWFKKSWLDAIWFNGTTTRSEPSGRVTEFTEFDILQHVTKRWKEIYINEFNKFGEVAEHYYGFCVTIACRRLQDAEVLRHDMPLYTAAVCRAQLSNRLIHFILLSLPYYLLFTLCDTVYTLSYKLAFIVIHLWPK